MVYISRASHFSAAHKLWNPKWSREKNLEVFGKCANEHGHGHNFDLIVTVKGQPDPETGFLINFVDLKHIINEEILEKVDHKNLDVEVDFLQGKLSTCETMVVEFWKKLAPAIRRISNDQVQLHCVHLKETANNYAEYYGE